MPRPIRIVGVQNKKPDTKQLALIYVLLAQAMLEQEEREAAEKPDVTEEPAE